MDFFYEPEYAKCGDVIPFYNDRTKRFENFYLKNWNPDAPKDRIIYGWHKIITEDNRQYEESPTNIHGGTGSVLYVDGIYHMFYCTFDKEPKAQWVRHAVSTDMEKWTDLPEEKFGPDGIIYKMSDWRDPFVFWSDEKKCWYMLLAARENTVTERNGCVALCTSRDFVHWEYQKPFYSPHTNPSAYECPDFFRMGDWYYLVYSNYTDGFETQYRMSRSLDGPWIQPEVDSFDGRAFYAAKTGSDGKDRFIYGWNPTRGENSWGFDPDASFGRDYACWNWGGAIVAHKIHQHEDGTLGVEPADSVKNAMTAFESMPVRALDGEWNIKEGEACADAEGRFSCALGCGVPDQGILRAKICYEGKPSRFGLALQVDEHFDRGYYLMFEPDRQRIQFRSGLRMYEQGGQMFPYAVEMERPLALKEGQEYSLDLYIQRDMAVLYVNNDRAFGFRMYNETGKKFGWFVQNGKIRISDCKIAEK